VIGDNEFDKNDVNFFNLAIGFVKYFNNYNLSAKRYHKTFKREVNTVNLLCY
jgi:hypothetical protein